jgi:hypothetical protein
MNKPLPIQDTCFTFIFDTSEAEDRESAKKFTIKDMRSQIKEFEQVYRKIEVLFEMLKISICGGQVRVPQNMAGQ